MTLAVALLRVSPRGRHILTLTASSSDPHSCSAKPMVRSGRRIAVSVNICVIGEPLSRWPSTSHGGNIGAGSTHLYLHRQAAARAEAIRDATTDDVQHGIHLDHRKPHSALALIDIAHTVGSPCGCTSPSQGRRAECPARPPPAAYRQEEHRDADAVVGRRGRCRKAGGTTAPAFLVRSGACTRSWRQMVWRQGPSRRSAAASATELPS
jgi:hypothetical protein